MPSATVTLAIETALDIKAARRLHDYGDLNDADVQRALEQVVMQRVGRIDWPAWLTAIRHIAAVVEQGDRVSVLDIETEGDEAGALSRFFAQCPEATDTIVAWQTNPAALIAARAFMHDMVAPLGLHKARHIALANLLDPTGAISVATDPALEGELACLTDGRDTRDESDPAIRLRSEAVNRYRWWLRWQRCQGEIDDSEREGLEAALAASEHTQPVSA